MSMAVMWPEKMAIQGLKIGITVTKKLLLIKVFIVSHFFERLLCGAVFKL
ncbi:hypothetical protein [Pseudochrobactrum sp. HB0163]